MITHSKDLQTCVFHAFIETPNNVRRKVVVGYVDTKDYIVTHCLYYLLKSLATQLSRYYMIEVTRGPPFCTLSTYSYHILYDDFEFIDSVIKACRFVVENKIHDLLILNHANDTSGQFYSYLLDNNSETETKTITIPCLQKQKNLDLNSIPNFYLIQSFQFKTTSLQLSNDVTNTLDLLYIRLVQNTNEIDIKQSTELCQYLISTFGNYIDCTRLLLHWPHIPNPAYYESSDLPSTNTCKYFTIPITKNNIDDLVDILDNMSYEFVITDSSADYSIYYFYNISNKKFCTIFESPTKCIITNDEMVKKLAQCKCL